MTKRALLVVAKRPAVGQTKTRLCPPLSGQEAAAIYECLLRDTLDLVRLARQQLAFDPILCYLPEGAEDYFREMVPDFALDLQAGRDLSERLEHATTTALTDGKYDQVVIMDSDSPTLSADYLCQAFTALDKADVSLGPCDDGGYYLIGLKRPTPDLFLKVQMSTPQVVADTLAIAQSLDLQVAQLPGSFDIDYVADLRRLIEVLDQLPASVAVHTREFLNGHRAILERGALAAGARVIKEPRRGYGYACAAGAAAAQGADAVIFLDGDGSFDPQEIPRLLAPLADDHADLVLGTRMTGGTQAGAMPPHQLYGNRLAAILIRLLYGVSLTDLGPFRAVRNPLLQSLNLREMTFGYGTEMIVKAAQRRARIVEVPVTYQKRWTGHSKVSGTIRGTLLASYTIIRVTFSRFL